MSQPDFGKAAFGFGLTLLIHSAVFWWTSKVFAEIGVFEAPLRWGQSGVLSAGYVVSKLWMAAVLSGRGK